MWKYLVVNALWFLLLFLVHFFGVKKDQRVILFSIFLAAAVLALKGALDPIAWFYYLGFSWLVFYGARDFRQWSFAELSRLKEELGSSSNRLTIEKEHLEQKTRQTRFLERKADEIVEFYEQIKEMSRSLEPLETFLIFSEALSEYFNFELVKLAFFSEKQKQEITGTAQVTKETEIMIDGAAATFKDLREGERIRGEVRVEKKGVKKVQTVLKIHVERPKSGGSGG